MERQGKEMSKGGSQETCWICFEGEELLKGNRGVQSRSERDRYKGKEGSELAYVEGGSLPAKTLRTGISRIVLVMRAGRRHRRKTSVQEPPTAQGTRAQRFLEGEKFKPK
jgi:hypothetical protein